MKKLIPLPLLLILTVVFLFEIHSCSNKDTGIVCTQNLPGTVSAGATILFSGCGSALGTYTWTFGDGATATGDSVTHVYTTTGTYSGSVNLTNLSNNVTKNFTIKVVNDGWIFNGMNFGADSVTVSSTGGTVTANSNSNNKSTNLVFVFPSLPASSGSYTVVNAANGVATGGNVFVNMYIDSANIRSIYGSTGRGNISAQVTVANGQISVSLPTIGVVNPSNLSDSTTLSANITQTQ